MAPTPLSSIARHPIAMTSSRRSSFLVCVDCRFMTLLRGLASHPAPAGPPMRRPRPAGSHRNRWARRERSYRRVFGSGGAADDAGTPPHPRARLARVTARTFVGRAARGSGSDARADSCGDGGLGGVEAVDGAEQVLVVLAQLQLDRARERRVAGQLERRTLAVAAGI